MKYLMVITDFARQDKEVSCKRQQACCQAWRLNGPTSFWCKCVLGYMYRTNLPQHAHTHPGLHVSVLCSRLQVAYFPGAMPSHTCQPSPLYITITKSIGRPSQEYTRFGHQILLLVCGTDLLLLPT